MTVRFKCYIPGSLRTLWLMCRYPNEYEPMLRAVITDSVTGEQFQVTEAENAVMNAAMEAMSEVPLAEAVASRKILNRALELGSDDLFGAMLAQRQGDDRRWLTLLEMTPSDWRAWWAAREAEARIEGRR